MALSSYSPMSDLPKPLEDLFNSEIYLHLGLPLGLTMSLQISQRPIRPDPLKGLEAYVIGPDSDLTLGWQFRRREQATLKAVEIVPQKDYTLFELSNGSFYALHASRETMPPAYYTVVPWTEIDPHKQFAMANFLHQLEALTEPAR